jgi:hypothetical protein
MYHMTGERGATCFHRGSKCIRAELTKVNELLAGQGRGVELRVVVQHFGDVPDSQSGPHPEAAVVQLA